MWKSDLWYPVRFRDPSGYRCWSAETSVLQWWFHDSRKVTCLSLPNSLSGPRRRPCCMTARIPQFVSLHLRTTRCKNPCVGFVLSHVTLFVGEGRTLFIKKIKKIMYKKLKKYIMFVYFVTFVTDFVYYVPVLTHLQLVSWIYTPLFLSCLHSLSVC